MTTSFHNVLKISQFSGGVILLTVGMPVPHLVQHLKQKHKINIFCYFLALLRTGQISLQVL